MYIYISSREIFLCFLNVDMLCLVVIYNHDDMLSSVTLN